MQTLRNRLARSFARAHRGMTLLEIMIVLAIIALVMGLLVGPRVMASLREARVKVAALAVKQYADEAYPSWAAAHPEKPCPDKLEELRSFTNTKDTKDPWGNDYKMYCGPTLPHHAGAFAVISFGEDGKEATPDDIKSGE